MATTTGRRVDGDATRERIIAAIRALTTEHQRPLKQDEICKRAGIGLGTLTHHLPVLEADGIIEREPGVHGSIRLRETTAP